MSKWQPMQPAKTLPLHAKRKREIERWARSIGCDDAVLQEQIAKAETAATFMNDKYVATVQSVEQPASGWPEMQQLSIRRIDRKPIHDWRHLQAIKNDIFSPDHEAVELYPTARRVVDTANSYHLWVICDPGIRFPFGWGEGLRTDDCAADLPNQQRPGSGG